MTALEFPRVLVVTSNNFNLVSGGGVTLTNLFRGWPTDRIANLHEDPTPEDHSVCQNFYRLSEEEIHWAWPFSAIQTWCRVHPSGRGQDVSVGDPVNTLSAGRTGVRALMTRFSRVVFGDGIPRNVCVSKRLQQWLDKLKPQILYGFLGSMAQIRLMNELARTYCIPVVVHIMDDWPAVLYRRGLFGPLLSWIVQREFNAVLRKASLHLAICQQMCEEYQERYGVSFVPFHNALDMDVWLPQAKRDWTAGSPFIVRYVGSIVPDGQRESLRDICEAVASLRTCGFSIEMWVHAPREQTAYLKDLDFVASGLSLVDPPPSDATARTLSGADLLVLPFNFDQRSLQYIRLSMPTKIPAYMVSGAPVLVYGPPEIATARYARSDAWGYVVPMRGVAPIQKALQYLMNDRAAREQLGRRAQMLAQQNHDATKVRPAFQAVVAEAAARRAPGAA